MNNVFKSYDVGIRFDLKGSTLSRRTLKQGEPLSQAEIDIKTALKDLDFIENIKLIKILVPSYDTKPKIEDILA